MVFTLFIAIATSGTAWSAILGIAPEIPNTTFLNPTGTAYDPVTRLLTVNATPLLTQMTVGADRVPVEAPRSLTISIQVNTAGELVSGVAGDDMILTGTVGGYSGILLTGEIIEFGIQDSSATIDYLDFRFRVTGGSMAPSFENRDIGVTQAIEDSNFNGSFSAPFKGAAKGNLGPIPLKQVCHGVIGDFVWNDKNRNGIQEDGESGIDNVTVKLKDSYGTLIGTRASGPNGAYSFTGLCNGDYLVEVDTSTLPSNFVPSPTHQGSDPARDSNQNSSMVSLTTDSPSDMTVDFGYNSPCSGQVGDLVWHDRNRNGIQDPGEPGIGNLKVSLRDQQSYSLITSTTTDGFGIYQFNGLCAGNYRVEVTPPIGFVATPATQGDNTAADSNPNPADVSLLNDNTVEKTIDFGFNTPCNSGIGDFVWNDLDGDGIQDTGEPGFNGVRVFLKNGFSNEIAAATTTVNGYYQFGGLCAGNYRIEVDSTTLPAGSVPSPTGNGTLPEVDSNPSPAAVILDTDSKIDPTIDFGYHKSCQRCSGTIGDLVWFDLNKNRIQDWGEHGISGVKVTLRNNITGVTKTTITDCSGRYRFDGLCAGSYTVTVSTPCGFSPSPANQGYDRAKDSNGSPVTVILSDDSTSDLTIDFGFNKSCAPNATGVIGDLVWKDLNKNGIQDCLEPGIFGVKVTLRNNTTGNVQTTTTDCHGKYRFSGLSAGTYTVTVSTPFGLSPSQDNWGTDRSKDSNGSPATVTLSGDSSSDLTVDFGFQKSCWLHFWHCGCRY